MMSKKIKCNWCESEFFENRLIKIETLGGDYSEKCPVCGHDDCLQDIVILGELEKSLNEDFESDFQNGDAIAAAALYKKLEYEQKKYYFDINKNGQIRVMYGTEKECAEYCKEHKVTYKRREK